jgi:hypothetical protein
MKKIVIIFSLAILAKNTVCAQTSRTDSTQIRSTIMSFYNWYIKNQSKINSFELYKGTKSSDTPPYKINWPEVNKYFAFIRSSVPWLGEAYIANQKKFFQECDSAFKADPEGEIPYGFDFDWYTNSQEDAGWLVDELKNATQWVTTVNGMDATVDVLGFYNDNGKQVETVILCYAMKKEKGKWKIARISCPYSKY